MHPTERPMPERPMPEQPTAEHPTAVRPPSVDHVPWTDTSWTGTAEQPAGQASGRRSPDVVALVAGALFVLVAVLALVGTALPGWVFGGGLVAAVLVAVGTVLLVTELRRLRR